VILTTYPYLYIYGDIGISSVSPAEATMFLEEVKEEPVAGPAAAPAAEEDDDMFADMA
jgi:hypothetical protein